MPDYTKIITLMVAVLLSSPQSIHSEEILLYEEKTIAQITEMKLDGLHYDIIFQSRLLNGRDEDEILKLLDRPEGLILNAAISSFMHTKNRKGLLALISMIERSGDKKRTNIYATIPYIGLAEWKELIQGHLQKIKADTEAEYTPLRHYSKALLSHLGE